MKRAVLFVAGLVACASIPDAPRAQERSELETLRARFPGVPDRPSERRAPRVNVTVPNDASEDMFIEDVATKIGARVRLEGAPASRRVEVDGLSLFEEAHVVMRAGDEGIEDFVAFEKRPATEELVYRVVPSANASLRFVESTFELLDDRGTPRLRMNPPYVIDGSGKRHAATVSVEGCAYDTSFAPPWDRPTTKPGSSECVVHVRWRDVTYPVLVDPSWTITGSGGARHSHTAVKLSTGRVLVFYGDNCSGTCNLATGVQVYDPATKTFSPTGAIEAKAANVPAVTLNNGKTLVLAPVGVGGQLYTPATGLFTPAGPSTVQRSGGSTLTVLTNGKVLAAGGGGLTAEIYDPVANTFTLTPNMKLSHLDGTATLLADGRVLLAGGGTSGAEIYDPVANTFTLTGSMSVSRTEHGAALLPNGKVLVVGGGTKVVELYDPPTGKFTTTTPLADARVATVAVPMNSGNVYIVGGFINHEATPIVERYEAATGEITPAPFLTVPRGYHRVTVLDNARLLVTFGATRDDGLASSFDTVEELDLHAPGAACTINDDCGSGICDLGVCCAAGCTASCRKCAPGTGACIAIQNADDPNSCTGKDTCDAASVCKKKSGQPCASGNECATGFCVNAFCCDRACSGQCEACDGTVPGRCETIAGPPRGKPACTNTGKACGGTCNGIIAATCKYPDGATSCESTCADATFSPGTCNNDGQCVARDPRPCPGNLVCANAIECKTSCATNEDCVLGYGCSDGKCIPTAYCDKDKLIGVDRKTETNCAPYSCDQKESRCRTACESVMDCAEGFYCGFDGQCVVKPTPPSGCSSTSGPRRTGGLFAIAVALAALLARRRAR